MKSDDVVFELIKKEENRQVSGIELIASENFTSPAVLDATGSILTNKYAEGYPGRRYYGGCEIIDEIEQIAIDRAKLLFGADYANVQPHSGSQANPWFTGKLFWKVIQCTFLRCRKRHRNFKL